jgi:hypothetical protein
MLVDDPYHSGELHSKCSIISLTWMFQYWRWVLGWCQRIWTSYRQRFWLLNVWFHTPERAQWCCTDHGTLDFRVICTLLASKSIINFAEHRYLASRFKAIRHFLALGGLLVAITGAAMIYGLPTERKVARLMFVYVHFNILVVKCWHIVSEATTSS